MDLIPSWSPRLKHVTFPHTRSSAVAPLPKATPKLFEYRQSFPDQIGLDDAALLRWILSQAGLEVRHYRSDALQRRIPACLRTLRVATPWQARRLLEDRPDLIPDACSSLLLGVTSFFRDAAVFAELKQRVYRDLLADRPLIRIWSVGCSEGAELYSVAIQLAELGLLNQSYMLGTDCRADAIKAARGASYERAVMKDMPAEILTKYFRARGDHFVLRPELANTVTWAQQDVLQVKEPGRWDLILCRNMAMYFSPSVAAGLWLMLERSLRPGGFLVLGKAERPTGTKSLTMAGPNLFRRVKGARV